MWFWQQLFPTRTVTKLLGFCLNITHIALKAWIFRYYPQTEVTLMCTEHFLMIRYKQKLSYSAVYYVLSNATLVLSIITIMTVIYIILEQRISRQIFAFFSYTLHCFLGLAVRTPGIGRVDLCSSPVSWSNLTRKNRRNYIF